MYAPLQIGSVPAARNFEKALSAYDCVDPLEHGLEDERGQGMNHTCQAYGDTLRSCSSLAVHAMSLHTAQANPQPSMLAIPAHGSSLGVFSSLG